MSDAVEDGGQSPVSDEDLRTRRAACASDFELGPVEVPFEATQSHVVAWRKILERLAAVPADSIVCAELKRDGTRSIRYGVRVILEASDDAREHSIGLHAPVGPQHIRQDEDAAPSYFLGDRVVTHGTAATLLLGFESLSLGSIASAVHRLKQGAKIAFTSDHITLSIHPTEAAVATPAPSTFPPQTIAHKVEELVEELERYLKLHLKKLFTKQHRDGKNKLKFSLAGSFKVGTGSTQVGNLQHVTKGTPGFVRHNIHGRNTAAFIRPVREQSGLSQEHRLVHGLAMYIIKMVDPEYASGETIVQFALMNTPQQYVRNHTDSEDVSFQYAMSLGDYSGAWLRAKDADGRIHDLDNARKIVRFDGRLEHEVFLDHFQGQRFTVIWYKNYDHRKTTPDPIWKKPVVVWDSADAPETTATAVDVNNRCAQHRTTPPIQPMP